VSTPLEDYAIIGDCETVALVSRRGSIDWLCWPRFDSGACFAALLGTSEHGRWLLEAVDADAQTTRQYRPNTLILETTIVTREGTVTVIDFMPLRGRNSDVVRLVRGDRGKVEMRTELVLRFDYGHTVPWVSKLPDGTFRAVLTPADFDASLQMDVHHGCRVLELISLDPPVWRRDPANGQLVTLATITSSDNPYPGPAACAYDPASSTGVLMTRRPSMGRPAGWAWMIYRTGLRP